MADTTLTNGNFWSTVFTTPITAINDTDSVLVKAASGTTDTIITAALLRAYLQKGITPSIGTDGYWYIGGVLIKDASGNPIQISAEGKTPTIAMKTIGGVKGLYLTYKGSSAEDTDWTLLVTATDLMFTFDDLTDAQKQSFLTYFTDAIANCNTAAANADTATANANTATQTANTAAANADTATANANTATQTANTAASNANAATKSATDAAASATAASIPSDYTSGVSEGIAHDEGEADSNRDNYNSDEIGDAHATTLTINEPYKVCGQSSILTGTSAPTSIPDFTGQIYIDIANGNAYIAVYNSTSSNWVKIN